MPKHLRRWAAELRISLDDRFPGLFPRTTRLYGHKFDLRHPRVSDIIRRALLKKSYERPEVEMIRRRILPSDRVVEVGTGIGATALVISDIVGVEKLWSFEGDPRTLELAQHNFSLNGKQIKVEHAVLWSAPNRPPSVEFSSNAILSGSSLIPRAGKEITVSTPARDLDEVLKLHRASAIVLDIEGGEIELLGRHTELSGIRTILMETHVRVVGHEANDAMLERLEELGFRVTESVRNGGFLALQRTSVPAAH